MNGNRNHSELEATIDRLIQDRLALFQEELTALEEQTVENTQSTLDTMSRQITQRLSAQIGRTLSRQFGSSPFARAGGNIAGYAIEQTLGSVFQNISGLNLSPGQQSQRALESLFDSNRNL